MSSLETQTPNSPAGEWIPDFQIYRERAHQERTKAINSAMSMLWGRLTRRRSRQIRDAAFWTA
ncbi:MAG: hypothetical protein ACSHXI_13540 [Hoeflea sp.]|uniref:hypothetical protein n=1 Tax=Hoeflea sp. TaxID=1940281 RepID=UPI003EF214BE